MRVILDSRLRLPVNSRVVETAQEDVIVFCSFAEENKRRALEARGVRVEQVEIEAAEPGLALSPHEGRPDLYRVVSLLGAESITSLLVEGGAVVNWAFLRSRLVDKLTLFFTPRIFGPVGAVPWLDGMSGLPCRRRAAPVATAPAAPWRRLQRGSLSARSLPNPWPAGLRRRETSCLLELSRKSGASPALISRAKTAASTLRPRPSPKELKTGDSCAVSGVCLTALEITTTSFAPTLRRRPGCAPRSRASLPARGQPGAAAGRARTPGRTHCAGSRGWRRKAGSHGAHRRR